MPRLPKTAKDRAELRDRLFPHSQHRVWPDKEAKGWCRIPRTLPIVLSMLDRDKSLKDGKDVTRTYLTLLANNWDEGLVIINDESEFAKMSGFTGTRAVRSWRERMTTLVELGFIEIKPRGDKTFGFALMIHPYWVVQKLQAAGKVQEGDLNLFAQKHLDFGASTPTRDPFTVIDGGQSAGSHPTGNQPTVESSELDKLLGISQGQQK